MENNTNRWMATALLLAMFGIIAYAGTRSTARQTTQNVLVTNTSSQPVPIPARPGTGAYIVSVANAPSVKVLNDADTHSGYYFGSISLPSTVGALLVPIPIPNSTLVVIDSVNFDGQATVSGEWCDVVRLIVKDSSMKVIDSNSFPLQPLADQSFEAIYSAKYRMLIPPGDSLSIEVVRQATTAGASVDYSFTYHTV